MAIATSLAPVASAPSVSTADRPLTLDVVLHELQKDGIIDAAMAEAFQSTAKFRNYEHPLTLIADQKWRSAKPPMRVLTLEGLTEWLALRLEVPYLHIDPLRVDFSAVSS